MDIRRSGDHQLWGTRHESGRAAVAGSVLLIKPPFFTPWTPPLGIATLKAFLERNGFKARCVDYNTDAQLWDTHHAYFRALQGIDRVSLNDGYSKLWWVLNAHMLAATNGASRATCARVLKAVIPLYGIRYDRSTIESLLPIVEGYFAHLGAQLDELDLSNVGVVGVSAYTTSLASSLFIIGWVKRRHPHIRTVIGGGVFADDLALGSENLDTLLRDYPDVDHVIVGEGELLLLALLRGELSGKRLIGIADIGGATLNMRDVPTPDFTDVKAADYFHLTIEGARSCPFQCSFCSETVQWGEYRKKPPELLVTQVLDLARRYRNNAFFLGDSLMNPYLHAFARELLRRPERVLYDGYLRADKPVTRGDATAEWAESGLYRVRIGVESAARNVLDAMHKQTTPETIGAALKALAAAGIRTTTYWIAGFPGETESDFQETLEFVREHRRFIYELEAHPYYYYPYGQVGSRRYESAPLYASEVTDVIRFKVWDIVGVSPTREERYDRLQRLSHLASELGLFNIYTMAERYAAEERWLRLHPLASPVFEETHPRRAPAVATCPAAAPEGTAGESGSQSGSPLANVWSYRVAVRSPLAVDGLRTAMSEVARQTEIMQVSLRGDAYVPANVIGDGTRTVHECPCAAGDLESAARTCAETLAREVRPRAGDSVRVAFLATPTGTGELLLLAHRLVFDARSSVLMFEDLFRAYEQIRVGRPVSLLAERSYCDAAIAAGDWPLRDRAGIDGGMSQHSVIHLPREVARAMCASHLARRGWMPGDLLLGALLEARSTSDLNAFAVDVTVDLRRRDLALERTVGPLTRIARLSEKPAYTPGSDAQAPLVPADLAALTRVLLEHTPERETSTDLRVLLDLEYLAELPWLGGLDWLPLGFIVDPPGLTRPYALEIMPFVEQDGVSIRLAYNERGAAAATTLAASLPAALASLLDDCHRYAAACDFWHETFAADVLDEAPSFGATDGAPGWSSSRQTAAAGLTPALMLAAFALVLARVCDREDLVIGVGQESPERMIPVRLRPAWHFTVGTLVRHVAEQLACSIRHGAYFTRALERRPLLRFAFVPSGPAPDPATFGDGLVLVLYAESEGSLRLFFNNAHVDATSGRDIASLLPRAVAALTRNPDARAGDVALDDDGSHIVAGLAADAFQF